MNLENFPTRETARDMMTMISPIYDRSYVGKWIFEVMAFPLGLAQDIVKDLEKQGFPETATWSLPWWEERYGIPTNESLPLEERQKAVTQRRNLKVPMNPYRITEIIKGLTGRGVELRENVAPHTYEITIFPGDSNVDLDAVVDTIGEIRQPQKHVNIVFEVPVGVQIQFGVQKKVFDYRLTGEGKKAGRWPQPSMVGAVADAGIAVDPDGSGAVFPYVLAGTRPDISTIGAVRPVNIEVDPAETGQPFPYPVAGTRPDVSTIGRVEPLEIDIDPETNAQVFAYRTAGENQKTGKYPDVSIIGRAETLELDIGPETGAQVFAYRTAGENQKTGEHPDVRMIGRVEQVKVDIDPETNAQVFVYQTAGEDKKAGRYPDVSTAGETAAPGINAHITGENASIVYKICGAKRL